MGGARNSHFIWDTCTGIIDKSLLTPELMENRTDWHNSIAMVVFARDEEHVETCASRC